MIGRIMGAEFRKLRPLCLWVPVINAVILLLFTCLEWYLYFRQGEAGVYTGLNVMYLFLSFAMLLSITLLCSMVAETEHQSQGLKLMFSLPVNRLALYGGKALWVIALMLLSCGLIIAGTMGIWVLYTDRPLPFFFLSVQVLGCFGASLPVLAIQLALSFRYANQTVALACGVIGAISSLFLGRWEGIPLYGLPWAYPAMASPFIPGYSLYIGLGLLLGLALLWLGAVRFGARPIT